MYLFKAMTDFERIISYSLRKDIISEFTYVLVDDTIEFDRNKYLIIF